MVEHIRHDHLQFWGAIAVSLGKGRTIIDALHDAKAEVAGTGLEEAASYLIARVNDDMTLSEAMAGRTDVFLPCVRQMVVAGEVGGVVQSTIAHIVEGLTDERFAVPGQSSVSESTMPRFWRALGMMVSAGVPIVSALECLTVEFAEEDIGKMIATIRTGVLDGKCLSDAMRELPEHFSEQVCVKMDNAGREGQMDVAAIEIASMLENEIKDQVVRDPMTTMLDTIISEAVDAGASDIHFDPTEDGSVTVRYRVDGVLQTRNSLPKQVARVVEDKIAILAALTTGKRNTPQVGQASVRCGNGQVHLRISMLPVVHGLRIVMRICHRLMVELDLDQVVSESNIDAIRSLCHQPHGIVICAGPAGSGKTTLLFSMLNAICSDSICVMSVEDPVEYRLQGVAQVQVSPTVGFARAIRECLRQDPDVMMVGEIRDEEVMGLAVQVAITGHLLLTQMHTNNATDTIRRMIDMGCEPYMVNSTLRGVISQRLVRKLCTECRQLGAPPPMQKLPPKAAEFIQNLDNATFYRSVGCDKCLGTGFRSRLAIHEILKLGEPVQQAIYASASIKDLRNAAIADGMKPMIVDGLEQAAAGITTIEEVCRVAPHE